MSTLRRLGKWEYVWDNALEAVCVWWYSPAGLRHHCGTFRTEFRGRIDERVRRAQRAMQDRYLATTAA